MTASKLSSQEVNPLSDAKSAPYTGADVRLAAMNLLARREHSLGELHRKLLRRYNDASLVDEQLHRLAEEKLQSDARFAETYIRMRAAKGYGPRRLCRELREKFVDGGVINAAFTAANIDWHAVAERALCKKFGNTAPGGIKERSRRGRFMAYRGFSSDHYDHLIWMERV